MLRAKIAGLALGAMAILLTMSGLVAHAGMVAPHAVFMDHRTRSGVFYVHNSGTDPLEVSVDLRFGYPVSDETGRVRLALFENPAPEEPSAAAWIRALPRMVVVPPGQRQAVRLLARPPAGLPDGEYWSRIIVTATAQGPLQTTEAAGNIQVGLRTATRTIISLNYRKGPVHTGVTLRKFDAVLLQDSLVVGMEMKREGNAAYLGRMELELIDEEGSVVRRWDHAVAVYHELYRTLGAPIDDLPDGPYLCRFRLTTDRRDISSDHVLAVEPVERALTVMVGTGRSR
jgi:hypothetical protein